ncbi:MAG: hypothetical protein E7515_07535 [Ruminococcaceae bacterium]|nr:hypothetical protein [Oscillospiraceae bacterium]
MKNQKTGKRLKKSLNILYREYRNEKSPNNWLKDNYYIFEREGQGLLKFYSDNRRKPIYSLMLSLFEICREIYLNGYLSDSDKTGKTIAENENSLLAFELAPLAFKTVIITLAGENASQEKETERAVKALRAVEETDFEALSEKYCENEKLLNSDEIYSLMTEECKSVYRKKIFSLAKRNGESERAITERLLKEKKHIGFTLFPEKKSKNNGYVFIELLLVLATCLSVSILSGHLPLFFLFLFPVWQILDVFICSAQMKKSPPSRVFSLDRKEIPDSAKTLVTVSMLLPNAKDSKNIEKHLTDLYASNRDKNISFCLLVDKKEFSSPEKPDDEANIAALIRVIERLNIKYSNSFFLFIRPRDYSKTGRVFTGKNRKMGAISALVKLISRNENGFETIVGDKSVINQFRYIFALDSDTLPSFMTTRKLIMTALHPLNRAVIDEKSRKIKSGYGIFSVQVLDRLKNENDSFFSLIMSGSGGFIAYDNLCCDRFSDVFGSGIFAGKGLIDIRAYDAVLCDRFKDERILSHDIIEGEFLKTLFVSDAQVQDAFPKSEASFLQRLHRWIRGDWQNIGFLFSHPSALIKKEKNPLPFISRVKLFENLRRSVTPVFSLLLLLASVLFDEKTRAVMITTAILGVSVNELYSFLKSLISGGFAMLSRLYYSFALPEALGRLSQAFFNVSMLPATAVKSFDAVLRALIRQFITKRKLLEWVTAADSEKSSSFLSVIFNNKFNLLCSAFLFIFHSPYTVLCAIIFLLNIPFDFLSSRQTKRQSSSLDGLTKERMVSHAAAIWKYYEKYADEKNSFLPADNVQFSPVFRVAQRTSPTNIGLFLACVIAAKKYEFISENEMLSKIESTLKSVEKLEKWNGNLLNWYDTVTLKPLEPKFVSTVDSGNFLCSLIAVKQGLKDISGNDKRAAKLIERIEKIIEETDLSPLYNKKRHLFHIGFDLSEKKLSGSYYDLIMSEARMTSYFAVSQRKTEKRHWGALSRIPGKAGRYTGPLSWSGTMFEFFLPNIFLPAEKGTFSYEGLRFCLYCQMLFAKGKRIPWGVSESAFYSFDSEYNYQYKAHGIPKLRLSRGNSDDLVISPYSSFLALPFSPKKAAANIKRLERLHLLGPYGLYEAADYTKSRNKNGECKIIKSYMAHHLGMSLLSILNATDSFYIQKLFMSDIDMAAGKTLLEERIPTFTPILKSRKTALQNQKDERRERFIKTANSFSVLNPEAGCYSNGEWTLTVCENGVTKSTYRDKCIFRHSDDFLFNPHSVTAVLRANGKAFHFNPFLNLKEKDKYRCAFKENEAVITYSDRDIKLSQRLSVHNYLPCEKRVFTLTNQSKRSFDGEVLIYFEPSLANYEAEKAHPAFSHLFLTESFNENKKILSFTRRDKDPDNQFSVSCRFSGDEKFSYSCNRERVLKRPDGIFSIENFDNDYSNTVGTPDCCALFSVPVKLSPREKKSITLVVSAAKTVEKAEEILLDGNLKTFENASSLMDYNSQSGIISKKILPSLVFRGELTNEQKEAVPKNSSSVDTLWGLGISGDKPIVLSIIKSDDDLPFLRRLLKIHNAFSNVFIKNDLVILLENAGDGLKNEVSSVLKDSGSGKSNTFVFNSEDLTDKAKTLLKAYCSYFFTKDRLFTAANKEFSPVAFLSGKNEKSENSLVDNGYEVNSSPVLPWCFIYSNDFFGTVVSDKSVGFTYAYNSFLNRLTKWTNDTRTDFNSELILIKIGESFYNPVKNSSVVFTKEKAVYKSICDGVEITVEIRVEKEKMQKDIFVRANNLTDTEKPYKIIYSVEPIMSSGSGKERLLHFEKSKNEIAVFNPLNRDFNGVLKLKSEFDSNLYLFDKTSLFGGEWRNNNPLANAFPLAALGKSVTLKKTDEAVFSLGYEFNESNEYSESENRIKILTPDKNLDALINTFLPVQIIRGRLQARTGFYQCSGAYGFRDQLQDCLSLSLLDRKRLKKQILTCALAQFKEGDVLHWFHLMPDGKLKGVRTRYSDDRLWLPLALSEYVRVTGDTDILETQIPYLDCEELKADENEKYVELYSSDESSSLFDHCVRAIERSLSFGKNSLPLIFGGDWNDGFNTVGRKGNGESVWLGEFLIIVLERFSVFCEKERRKKYLEKAKELRESIDRNAFENDRYIRAFLDDGTPVGSDKNGECKIDSLSQSFAVFCKMPDKNRVRTALDTAEKMLVDRENGVIKLFSDGFKDDRRAGYISAYPVGLRENAGQYTHAAVWLASAFIESGQTDKGYELLKIINPLNKYENEETAKRYLTEPYFLAGDVYSRKGVEGRGGWSIYTGSAGWYYKTVIEKLFGIKKTNDIIFIEPSFPSDWENCSLLLTLDGANYEIEYKRNDKNVIFVDGSVSPYIQVDGKSHKIIVNFCGNN